MTPERRYLRQSDNEAYLRRLLAANEPGQAIYIAVEHVADELGCPVSWVGLIEGDHLVMGGHVGLVSAEMATAWRLRVGDGIGGRVAAQRRPHMSRDYRHDSRRDPLMKRLIDNEGIQATLTVPLLSADTALGVLYAANHRPYPWSEHEQFMLEQIAQDLATRLRQLDVDGRADLEREAAKRRYRRALDSQRRFGALASSLSAQDEPQVLLDLLAREVEAVVDLVRDGGSVLRSSVSDAAEEQPEAIELELDGTDGLVLRIGASQPLDELDVASAELGASLFRLQWLRLAERERTFERLSENLLGQLLSGRITDPEDLLRRTSLLGLNLDRGRVYVIGSRRPAGEQLAHFEERLRRHLGPCLVSQRGARLVVVLEVDEGRNDAEQLRALMAAPSGRDLVAGVGRLCTAVGDYAMSYDHARAACELGLRGSSSNVILSTKDFGSLALASLPLSQLRTVAYDALGTIIDFDRQRGNSDLLDTVQTYLAHDRHLPSTAAALHVHYNTVRKRVAKLEELLGLEFGNVEDRFRVEAALRAYALTRVLDEDGSAQV